MRRIIEGKAYDTETATRVATGEHDHELSQAWWSLYRTSAGAWFEVAADHDGVVEQFEPKSDLEAKLWLERHANHLVEQYFGPVPEASSDDHKPLRFSRRTVIAARVVLERLTQANITQFFYELGPDFPRLISGDSISKSKRLDELMGLYDAAPDRVIDGGGALQDAIVEKAVSLISPAGTAPWRRASATPAPDIADFLRVLDRDGFSVTAGALRRALPTTVRLPEATDEISRLLTKHGFNIAKGHLDQAFANHTSGNWASANSQVRSFFDGLLDEIAVKIDPAAASLGSGQPRRTVLATHGFLSRDLNEWSDQGLGFVNGLVKRLHPHGSHPGLSDQDDSTFRLHTVLLTARLLLVRIDRLP